MIFYHFTTRAALEAIGSEGLNRGEAPLNERRVVQAVNLTTDPHPAGHGLDHGGQVITEAQAAFYASQGFNIPAGTVLADKLEARIKLKLPSTDRNLKQWRPWSRKHCDEGWPERLEAAAGVGNKARSWWLYFGTIPPSCFLSIDVLKPPA